MKCWHRADTPVAPLPLALLAIVTLLPAFDQVGDAKGAALAPYSRLAELLIDRGYLGSPDIGTLHARGLTRESRLERS